MKVTALKNKNEVLLETISIFGDWRQGYFRAISSQISELMYISSSSTYCESAITVVLFNLCCEDSFILYIVGNSFCPGLDKWNLVYG